MILEAYSQALRSFADPTVWLWMTGGVVFGLLVGVIPGIEAVGCMALFLPFAFRLEPMQALPFLLALAAVAPTGGSITAVLLGIPGDPVNIVTTFDGFPMTKKGEGGRALGAALTSSLMGGAAPVVLALLMVMIALPVIMAITSIEMVFIILLGLAFIAVVGKGSMLKSLISGAMGLLIACIGLAPASGEARFTFGNPFLYDGIHIVPAFLGLFAIPPMVELAIEGGSSGTIARAETVIKGCKDVWRGIKDVFVHWKVWLYSSGLGYLFGVIPGLGALGATFISYGYAKRTSKYPEKFGTGVVDGVIAPESCANAKESGALLCTMALGVPGSSTQAMLLAALMILGLQPGPTMMTQRLDLTFSLLMVVFLANVMGGVICLALASNMSKVANVPARILIPTVLGLIYVGAFLYKSQIEDIVVMLVFGAAGVAIQKLGYNIAALVLGFILGPLFEKYLFRSVALGGATFFMRPISIALILVIIALFAYGPITRAAKRRLKPGAGQA